MAAKLSRLTHKIAIQLDLVAEIWTICSSGSRWPGQKLWGTPSDVLSVGILSFFFVDVHWQELLLSPWKQEHWFKRLLECIGIQVCPLVPHFYVRLLCLFLYVFIMLFSSFFPFLSLLNRSKTDEPLANACRNYTKQAFLWSGPPPLYSLPELNFPRLGTLPWRVAMTSRMSMAVGARCKLGTNTGFYKNGWVLWEILLTHNLPNVGGHIIRPALN
jgi:hypothetical protein